MEGNQNKIPENELITKDTFKSAMKDILSGFFLDFIYPLKANKRTRLYLLKRILKIIHSPKNTWWKKRIESNDYLISSSKYFAPRYVIYQKGFIQKTSSENFVNAFNDGLPSNTNIKGWGKKTFVYMIDKLIDEKLITDRKRISAQR